MYSKNDDDAYLRTSSSFSLPHVRVCACVIGLSFSLFISFSYRGVGEFSFSFFFRFLSFTLKFCVKHPETLTLVSY